MLDGDKTLSLVQPRGMLRDSDRTQKLRLPDAKPGRDQRCEKGVTNEMKSRGKGGKKAYPILGRAGWDYDLHSPSLTTQFWIKPASAPGVREGKICCAVSGDQQICQPRRGAARLKLTKKQKKKKKGVVRFQHAHTWRRQLRLQGSQVSWSRASACIMPRCQGGTVHYCEGFWGGFGVFSVCGAPAPVGQGLLLSHKRLDWKYNVKMPWK